MKEILINIDNANSTFILNDSWDKISNNKRLIISLKRLGFQVSGNSISIPFDEKTKIATLDEIQNLLSKFGYSKTLSQETVKDVKSYEREQTLFMEFSEKARNIRNDQFHLFPELVEDFDLFQSTLKKQLIRQLYPLQLLSAFHMTFSQNSCNFSVPGSGKTSIVYGAYAYLKQLSSDDPRYVDRILVIGPLSSFAPWENEYFECFGKKAISKRLSGDTSISRIRKEEHLYSGNPAELT